MADERKPWESYEYRASVNKSLGLRAPIPTEEERATLLEAEVERLTTENAALRAALVAWQRAAALEVETGQSWRVDRAYREAAVLRDAALGDEGS